MAEHTKWEIDAQLPNVVVRRNKSGRRIIEVISCENVESARRICQCVNSHDALLDACKGKDKDIYATSAGAILKEFLVGDYKFVKLMLSELCSVQAQAIAKAENTHP